MGWNNWSFPKTLSLLKIGDALDFTLMPNRIKAVNIFVARIKTNTVYDTITELELPGGIGQNIQKDEIDRLTSRKAKEVGTSECKFRLVHVWKEDKNKVITIITNQMD